MRKVIDVLSSDAFKRYQRNDGAYDASDVRFALMDPRQNSITVPARKAIYAALAATAASAYPYGGNGASSAARIAAAKECVEAWPKCWNIEAGAAVDPIFDDRFI